jgi:hypothetical protein
MVREKSSDGYRLFQAGGELGVGAASNVHRVRWMRKIKVESS